MMNLKNSSAWESDIFISYASEDKDEVAKPLAHELRMLGYRVWYDDYSLRLGDSLQDKIDHGLATCRYGVVILSQNFLRKPWPRREIKALFSRELAGGFKTIIPVWHNIDEYHLAKYSLPLADRVAVSTSDGLSLVIQKLRELLDEDFSKDVGLVGAVGDRLASFMVYAGLCAFHRTPLYLLRNGGTERASIMGFADGELKKYAGPANGDENYWQRVTTRLCGQAAIGQVNYSCGPYFPPDLAALLSMGHFAMVHDFSSVGSGVLRELLKNEGSVIHTNLDAEVVFHLMAKQPRVDPAESLVLALGQLDGAYALLMLGALNNGKVLFFAARDPYGKKFLCYGKLRNAQVFATSRLALDLVGAEFERELDPGEVFAIEESGAGRRYWVRPHGS
jgi:TIR domain/Glutamine amidotransferase domain